MTSLLSLAMLTTIVIRVLRSDDRLPRRSAMLVLFICADATVAVDLIWGLNNLHYLPRMQAFSGWLSAAYYISIGLLCYACFLHSELVQQVHFTKHRLSQITSAIPFTLLVVMSICSVWTGWIFVVDETGKSSHGPLYWAFLLLAYNYLVFTSVEAFLRSGRMQHYARRDVFRTLACFVLPLMLCAVLHELLPDVPVLCVGISLGALIIYANSLEQQISLDGLTGLNNRMQLVRLLAHRMRDLPRDRRLFILMMDADGFKRINDSFGHVEGDRALRSIAEALRRVTVLRPSSFCARYGGDEFTLVHEVTANEELAEMIEELRMQLQQIQKELRLPYTLSLSIGQAEYDGKQSIPELIMAADKALYSIKKPKRSA